MTHWCVVGVTRDETLYAYPVADRAMAETLARKILRDRLNMFVMVGIYELSATATVHTSFTFDKFTTLDERPALEESDGNPGLKR